MSGDAADSGGTITLPRRAQASKPMTEEND
jgi:hypothetical protein